MNPILDVLMNASGGEPVQQIGRRFGLSTEQTSSALSQLVPALMAGLQRNALQEGGMEVLLGALSRGNHTKYLDNPEILGQESTTQDGNAILGHIFGSKDVSRAVVNRATEETGVGVDVLKKMLPLVATMVMGGLSKKRSAAADSGGVGGLLGSFVDQNRDGSAADDVMGVVDRLLGGR